MILFDSFVNYLTVYIFAIKSCHTQQCLFWLNFVLYVGFKAQTNTLTYELPSSIEVAFGRSIGSQIALVTGGSLGIQQLSALQKIVSRL